MDIALAFCIYLLFNGSSHLQRKAYIEISIFREKGNIGHIGRKVLVEGILRLVELLCRVL